MKLHHIGIIIPERAQMELWETLFQLKIQSEHYVEEYQSTLIFCETENGPSLEFIIPEGGVLQKFNNGRGGLHHIAVEVSSIDDVRSTLRSELQIDLLEAENVQVDHLLVNFLPPIVTRGVIVEYVQVTGSAYQVISIAD